MKHLRGTDAYAIYSETPTSPFVSMKVAIYRPAVAVDSPDTWEVWIISGLADRRTATIEIG